MSGWRGGSWERPGAGWRGGSAEWESLSEAVTGGSEAEVEVVAQGGGIKIASGGSEASVTVQAEGDGLPITTIADGWRGGSWAHPYGGWRGGSAEWRSSQLPNAGGSSAVVQVVAEGVGTKVASGGSEAIVEIETQAGGGAVAVVLEDAGDYRFEFDGNLIVLTVSDLADAAYTVIASPSVNPTDDDAVELDVDSDDITAGAGTIDAVVDRATWRYGSSVWLFVRQTNHSNGIQRTLLSPADDHKYWVTSEEANPEATEGYITINEPPENIPVGSMIEIYDFATDPADDFDIDDLLPADGPYVETSTGLQSWLAADAGRSAQALANVHDGDGWLSPGLQTFQFAVTPIFGGSEARVEVEAQGAGSKLTSGGSEAEVEISAEGGGQVTLPVEGSSEAIVLIFPSGGGLKVGQGGSECAVEISAQGAGVKQEAGEGGAEARVFVLPVGAGRKAAVGGSEAAVEIGPEGAGERVIAGGSESVVEISAAGSGAKSAASGSSAVVVVLAEGDNRQHSYGGGEAVVIISAQGHTGPSGRYLQAASLRVIPGLWSAA